VLHKLISSTKSSVGRIYPRRTPQKSHLFVELKPWCLERGSWADVSMGGWDWWCDGESEREGGVEIVAWFGGVCVERVRLLCEIVQWRFDHVWKNLYVSGTQIEDYLAWRINSFLVATKFPNSQHLTGWLSGTCGTARTARLNWSQVNELWDWRQ